MIAFLALAAGLAGGALLLVLRPMLGRRKIERSAGESASLAFYRGELAHLERERAAGRMPEAEYGEEKLELQRRMLEDAAPAAAPLVQRSPRRAGIAVALAVPLVAGLVYTLVGNWRAIDAPPAQRQASHAVTAGQINAMVERLARRLSQAPDDIGGWTMLARSLAALGRYQESADAFARLAELVPGNAAVLADYADTLAMARGRKLDGPPFELVKRALAADPQHLKSLALAGSAEFERGDFRAATRYWERILKLVPADSDFARAVQGSIAQARDAGRHRPGS